MRGALKTSRWVEKAPCDLGGNNRVRIIGQAGWHVETGTFEGAHASRNELLSCWPSTLVWLVSELRAAFPSGPGDRRRQEAFGLGRAGIPMWDCSVEREVGTTVLMGQPGLAAHRAFQSESHSSALQGQARITVSASKWGKGGGPVARATVAVEALLTMGAPGKHPGPGARWGHSSCFPSGTEPWAAVRPGVLF